MIMEMIPQGYPLTCSTEDGNEWLVVGWTIGSREQPDGTSARGLVPIVVPRSEAGQARLLTAVAEYRRPTDRARA